LNRQKKALAQQEAEVAKAAVTFQSYWKGKRQRKAFKGMKDEDVKRKQEELEKQKQEIEEKKLELARQQAEQDEQQKQVLEEEAKERRKKEREELEKYPKRFRTIISGFYNLTNSLAWEKSTTSL